jgi:aspartyl/glutamyl-tRNA(Asn/Gln) amidotransferase C subunit
MQLADIKKLADLSRIDMSETEMQEIAKSFDSILAYVGQVQELSNSNGKDDNGKSEDYFLHNVMREDIATNKAGEYTEAIMTEVPETQDGFVKVKQIL